MTLRYRHYWILHKISKLSEISWFCLVFWIRFEHILIHFSSCFLKEIMFKVLPEIRLWLSSSACVLCAGETQQVSHVAFKPTRVKITISTKKEKPFFFSIEHYTSNSMLSPQIITNSVHIISQLVPSLPPGDTSSSKSEQSRASPGARAVRKVSRSWSALGGITQSVYRDVVEGTFTQPPHTQSTLFHA